MDNELKHWREQAEHWHEEAVRLRKELEAKKELEVKQRAASPSLSNNHSVDFVTDMCRYSEGILNQQQIRKKWRELTDKDWERAGNDDALCDAIEAEKVRRIRNGQAKQEKAQSLVVKTPEILDSIASDKSASPRHRVDAIKTLDGMSGTGPQATPPELFRIVIDLTADAKLKGIEPNPNDIITFEATRPTAITDKTEDDWTR
jgi:hypothetical protein